jgi:uroporphyrin-III C-methyltransferase / precorrin-2 dehydrogenase / sirohydrochlorin ferrochelatase
MSTESRRAWPHPVFIDLAGVPVVVVGGGSVAERRIEALVQAGAKVTVVSPAVTEAVARWADSGRLTLQRRAYVSGDLRGARLAYAATSDDGVNRAVREEASAEAIWLNAVDQPDLCDFITPAVVRRGDLTLAVSTSGRCPGLARQIREDLERRYGPEYADMLDRLGELRRERKASGTGATTASTEMDAILDGIREAAARPVADSAARPGTVYLVGAGPGDPELLTVKGRRLLETADVVVYDALVDQRLLDLCRPGAARIYVGKRERRHTRPQAEINALLVEEAQSGRAVVRLKGGDPFIFGRGGEEAEALVQAGVPYEVVPGVSAGVAVPAYAGIPLTHREFTSELVFLTGHECGTNPTPVDWSRYGASHASLVIFMGLHNIGAIARQLIEHGRDPGCPVAVIENGATDRQRTIVAPLARIAGEIASAGIEPPALIVVGEVVRLRERLEWFKTAAAAPTAAQKESSCGHGTSSS